MSEAAIPFPPRHRWLKRGLAVGLCVLLALAGLRWWWGRVAQRRINAVIADARAHGEPILPKDFPPEPPIPDSENAVASLYAAAVVHLSASTQGWESNFEEPPSATDYAMMRQIEADNGVPLAFARAARVKHMVDWGYRSDPASIPPVFARLNYLRFLAEVLAYCARGELGAGHCAAAIEFMRDLRAEARAMDAHPSWVIVNLVGVGVDALGTDVIINNSPIVNCTPEGARPLAASIHGLIDELLDEAGLASSIAHGFCESAMGCLRDDSSRPGPAWIPLSIPVPQPLAWALRPIVVFSCCREAADDLVEARAVGLPNEPAANAVPRVVPRAYSGGASALEEFSRQLQIRMPGVSGAPYMRWKFILISDRRAAAVMLALRLYQFDHGDELPEKLSDLVPHCLAALPADPMRVDGGTFCYLPHANPPILYSVGLNGKDDGGSSALISGGYPGSRWDYLDAVYLLVPAAPVPSTTAPSTQAQDNN